MGGEREVGGGCLTAYSTVMMDGGGEKGKCILTHTTAQIQIKLHIIEGMIQVGTVR